MVRVRVDVLEELLDAMHLEIASIVRFLVEPKGDHEVSELVLVEDTIPVGVYALEHGDEVAQELFVLLELEVEDALEEDSELELGRLRALLLVLHHAACQGSTTGLGLSRHQVRAGRTDASADLLFGAL